MTNPSDHQQAYLSRQLAMKIAVGDLSEDQAQMIAARRLDDLSGKLCRAQSLNWFKKLLCPPQPVMGLYLYGGVGRGKTMLMDMFVIACPSRNGANGLAVAFPRFYGVGPRQYSCRSPSR